MAGYGLGNKLANYRAQLDKKLGDAGALVSERQIWCGLCCKLMPLSRLATIHSFVAHMGGHNPNLTAMLKSKEDTPTMATFTDPPHFSTRAVGGSRVPGATQALQKFTADEVRSTYRRAPDAATLVSEHGLKGTSAVYTSPATE